MTPSPHAWTRTEIFAAVRVCLMAGQVPLYVFGQRFIVFAVHPRDMFGVRRALGYWPWKWDENHGFEFLVNVEDSP